MKSTRKPNGTIAAKPAGTFVRPVNQNDQLSTIDEYQTPELLMPANHLRSEEESFRNFLNNKLPKKKASPALMQRIRHSIQELENNH